MPPYQDKQDKAHYENALQTKKNALLARARDLRDHENAIRHLEGEIAHIESEMKRTEQEIRTMETKIGQEESTSESADTGMREKEQDLRRQNDEIQKVEREVHALKKEIEEKEQKLTEIKREISGLMKGKEDFRRTKDLGHFDVQNKIQQIHDKDLLITRYKQELERKRTEEGHKEKEREKCEHLILSLEEDIREIETALRNMSGTNETID